VLRSTHGVQVEMLGAARAGVRAEQLSPTHGRIKLLVAGNSVATISPST